MGYFFFDVIFCYFNTDEDEENASAWQNYAHHFMALGGYYLSLKCGGLLASVCQLTAITEFATITVDLRVILHQHKLSKTLLYAANGITMTFHFFLFRVVFYNYIIWGVVYHYYVTRGNDIWNTHAPEEHIFVILSIALYCLMISLNMYWFYRMFMGLMKGLGLIADAKK